MTTRISEVTSPAFAAFQVYPPAALGKLAFQTPELLSRTTYHPEPDAVHEEMPLAGGLAQIAVAEGIRDPFCSSTIRPRLDSVIGELDDTDREKLS